MKRFALLLLATRLCAQVVTINGSDSVAASRSTINNNFSYLNSNKLGGSISTANKPLCTLTSTTLQECVYLLTPTMYGNSGNSTTQAIYAAGNYTHTSVEPTQTPLPAVGNLQTGFGFDSYMSGLLNPADYGNLVGQYNRIRIWNGRNVRDNSDKKTLSMFRNDTFINGSGQANVNSNSAAKTGRGDLLVVGGNAFYFNDSPAAGDEGVVPGDFSAEEDDGLSFIIAETAGAVTTSTCAITALAANVAKSTGPTDLKTVNVTGATTNCVAGTTWLDIDNGVMGVNSAGPTGDLYHESIQITGKTSSSITALFQSPHSSGAPVAPSQLIAMANNEWGQEMVIVDTTATPYTSGSGAYVNGRGLGSVTVTGIGTTWTSLPGYNDVNQRYCISFRGDDFAGGPFTVNNLIAWFPLASITNNTTATLAVPATGYTGYVSAVGLATGYSIAPCGRTSMLVPTISSTTETLAALVMRATGYTWTAGHTLKGYPSPVINVLAIVRGKWNHYGLVGQGPNIIESQNIGYQTATAAFGALGSGVGTREQFQSILRANGDATTSIGSIRINGRDTSGVGAIWSTFSGPSDPKQFLWQGAHNAAIEPNASNGLTLSSLDVAKIRFLDPSSGKGPSWDYSAMSTIRAVILEDVAGHMVTSPSGLGTTANKPSCIDANGQLFAGTNTAGVLTCP